MTPQHAARRSTAPPAADQGEQRLTAGMRLLLAATALGVTTIDPSEPSRFVAETYAVLVVYVIHAALVYGAAIRDRLQSHLFQLPLPWVDVGTYVTLVGLSGGSNSIYFVLFFFGILVASFRSGYRAGVAVTAVSVVLFVIVGYVARPAGPEFDLNRFLLRSSSLPVLGYLMANRGGYEVRLRRRLGLLQEIATLSNPRFGAGRTFGLALEMLRDFYDADVCVAAVWRGSTAGELRRARRGHPDAALVVEPLESPLYAALTPFEPGERVWFTVGKRVVSWNATRRDATRGAAREDACRELGDLLGLPNFMSVPLSVGSRPVGRVYVAARKPRFDREELGFLAQAVDQMMPAIDHIGLVERMASRAADDERQRIALDIHDRIVQPYIGLQIGLTALHQLATARADAAVIPLLSARAQKLLELTASGTSDLRAYMQGLRQGGTFPVGLADALSRFAERFEEATGIGVTLRLPAGLQLDDRLSTEVFSLVTEAVSNVRRHTNASRVDIDLSNSHDRLVLRVSNQADPGVARGTFTPRSIVERAAAVGGVITAETIDGHSAVVVEIPL